MGAALKYLDQAKIVEIARGLFEVVKEDDRKGELHGKCPIHGEANASFSYNFLKDKYHCFACGASGDLIKLWSEVHGHDQKSGFKAFCETFGIDLQSERSGPGDRPSGVQKAKKKPAFVPESDFEALKPLPRDWIERLVKQRGWTEAVIVGFDLRVWNNPYKPEERRIAIPIRDRDGNLLNIRLYLPGAEENKIISFFKGRGKSRKTWGGNQLFPPPTFWPGDQVWLCEGEPDTLCAHARGLPAVTGTAGARSWKDEFTPLFAGRDVVICFDADRDGQAGAEKVAHKLARVAKLVRIVQWPDWMGRGEDGEWPEKHGQDLTDFLVWHKKNVEDLKALLASARTVNPSEATDLDTDGPRRFFVRGANGRSVSFKSNLLAQEILSENELMTDPVSGLTFRWNGEFWKEFNLRHIRRICLQKLGVEGTRARAEDAASQVADLALLDPDKEIDPFPHLLCLKNGMLDIDRLAVLPHKKSYLATYQFGVTFDPRTPEDCPRWLRFLDQTVQDTRIAAELQEFFGYCLTKETRYEKALLLIGPGSDGKSTCLNVLQELLGPENCSSVDLSYLDNEFYRASLHGKFLNVATEIEAQYMTSGAFKAIVSGDSISAAYKHQPVFEFRPVCKLAFSSNRWPRVQDNSHGFFRRLLPVKFRQRITPERRDPHLFDKLKEELNGIFAWALKGLERLRKRGFFEASPVTEHVLSEYQYSNNPVLGFIEECTTTEPLGFLGPSCTKADMYEAYQGYCKRFGFGALNDSHFSRELKEAVPEIKDTRPRDNGQRIRRWEGIRLINAEA